VHKHHIIPKHMGGSDDPSNIIELTVEDHAEAHRKLWEEHGIQYDFIAWRCLSGQITNEEAQKEAVRFANTGRPSWNKGKKTDKATRAKLSLAHKGKPPGNKGMKGQIPWNKDKVGVQEAWNKGKELDESHKQNLAGSYDIEKVDTGEIFNVVNLRVWCQEHGISDGSLHSTYTGKRNHCQGYRMITKHKKRGGLFNPPPKFAE